ncbi:hypothetical protein BU24DRAFT_461261 [Aaosphaeria arxii CBS 175.79]|uniref:Uncharacterized protein n=1 Tax=Aaosphaeria arxii CBS 175.79 TaxID=1450172 RepID=A0A6A5XYR5_9PLEO|nr:uncharacterized protein BU24DRAFT_461261 [Aaosphaeria arxii CBS 175.79]KAF2018312.1 hypothetical protein BU24DRAFT_461261 [Aaosphaeria arxii CBS 175.79]
MKAPWMLLFEAWAVQKLLRSPAFNSMVQKAYRKINGLPPMGPDNGHGRTGPSAFDHFRTEVKNQFRELTWQKKPPRN